MKRGFNRTLLMSARRQLGFSLIELMIIIAIVGTLSAIAIPNIISYRDNARLKAGANEMLALFRKAQVNAVKRHFNTVLDFSTAGAVTVFLDNVTENSTQDVGEPTLDQYTVPIGCSLPTAKITFAGDLTGFNQRGLPLGLGGTVEVHSNSASSKVAYGIVLSVAGHTRIDVIHL